MNEEPRVYEITPLRFWGRMFYRLSPHVEFALPTALVVFMMIKGVSTLRIILVTPMMWFATRTFFVNLIAMWFQWRPNDMASLWAHEIALKYEKLQSRKLSPEEVEELLQESDD